MLISRSEPSLPVEAVRNLAAQDGAGWLGLEPAGERGRKFACLWCDSTDAMHVYPQPGGGVHCFSCGHSGSVIDLVMAVRGLAFRDAVTWLADRVGIHHDGAGPIRSGPAGRPAPAPTGEPDPQAPAVFTAAWQHLSLTDQGRAYLASRGLPFPETALEAGFRSLDGVEDLRQLYRTLRTTFPKDLLDRLITPRRWLPFGDTNPVLLIGYQHNGTLETFRIRNRNPAAGHNDRYRDLRGYPPTLPWHADSLTNLARRDLHIVEGELNAFTLWGCASRLAVVALPGAGRIPGGDRASWLQTVGQAGRVVLWFDPDQAGDKGAHGLGEALHQLHPGLPIVRGRPDIVGDFVELYQRGELERLVSPLRESAAA